MIQTFGNDREAFARVLHANISPTSPVQSPEHLYGREKQIQQIEQALYSPGRSIFIYGDRGVGKTSLAQTVAYSHQSAASDPILLACSAESTFTELMTNVVEMLRQPEERHADRTVRAKLLIPAKVPLGVELEHTHRAEEHTHVRHASDLNSIIDALLHIRETKTLDTVVVLDEFDRIAGDTERTHFADLIKQVGDKQVPVRFVFCGVADSMQKLLGAHGSCYRYLEGVELQRLSWQARFEIIDSAANALQVTVDDRPRYRISAISDGFPHYIHLICEKLFWQMFNDSAPCSVPNINHFREAVSEAVMGIEQHLRTTYDEATARDTSDYEELLWAMADHPDFLRSTESIYESYWQLFGGLDQPEGRTILDRATVVARLNALKGSSRGRILANVSNRRGWYQFRESIMRGYVRLRAEEQDIELAQDYSAVGSAGATPAYPVRGARRSKRGSSRADWEKIKNPPSGY